MWLTFSHWNEQIVIENPSAEDFNKALDLLDKEFTHISLSSDKFSLILINHYWDDRVFVEYSDRKKHKTRTLVDSEIPDDKEWSKWIIEIWTPAYPDRPIKYTVPTAIATEVAKYVFEYKAMPPDYSWSDEYGY